ncbi:MAG: LPS-assembly protein LptD [Acidobacteria bacterium]|nr:LPS-assembly protein LptD [Acidobacteriota bacterium]
MTAPPDSPLSRITRNTQNRLECFSLEHCQLTGAVDIEVGPMTRFFADQIDIFVDPELRIVASGNVVFTNPEGRIAAERVEFNVSNGTGMFHMATGSMSLAATADRAQFAGQDPDVYFYGETIEKVSAQSYRLTRGAFTTCVQPTPRWEIVSDSIVINMNDYAIARNMLLRVKGVPLMYLPVIYYPIKDDDRATGFLLPTYGTSTIRGQALSNAFFWAIGRNQDATFYHDLFTKAGQGTGAEYRYVAGQGSFGNFRFYRFAQRESEFKQAGGRTEILPHTTSYQFTGVGNQTLGPGITLQENIDYTSDLVTKQLYQQNIYQASNASRTIGAALSGNWGRWTTTGLFQRTETFTGTGTSTLHGSAPRVTAAIASTRLGSLPAYGSLNADYAYLLNRSLRGTAVTRDTTVGRFDLQPRIQAALSRLTFLSVNTAAFYRMTHYSRNSASADPIVRRYLSLQVEAVGPVFARIWDTVDSTFSERMKHVIEPTFVIDHVTGIPNLSVVPITVDTSDRIVGGSTRFTYGINNRFLYRARTADGAPGATYEFLTVGIQQTYYLNPEASLTDTQYASSSAHAAGIDLSDVAVIIRASPRGAAATAPLNATARLEYDVHGRGLQVITSAVNIRKGFSGGNISYSRSKVERPAQVLSSLGGGVFFNFLRDRLTGGYDITWDITRGAILTQSVSGTYLAQCCGIQAEFQKFKFPVASARFPIPADRRFNVSLVLAGLGTFSNFFGALGLGQ